MPGEIKTNKELHAWLRSLQIRQQPMPELRLQDSLQGVEVLGDASHLVRLPRQPNLAAGRSTASGIAGELAISELHCRNVPGYVTCLSLEQTAGSQYLLARRADQTALPLGAIQARVEDPRYVPATAGVTYPLDFALGPDPINWLLTSGSILGTANFDPITGFPEGAPVIQGTTAGNYLPVSYYMEPGDRLYMVDGSIASVQTVHWWWLEVP